MAQDTNITSNFHNNKPLDYKPPKNDMPTQDGDFQPMILDETILRSNTAQNAQQVEIPEPTTTTQMGLDFNMDDDDDGNNDAEKVEVANEKVSAKSEAEQEQESMALANTTIDLVIFGCTQTERLIKISDKKLTNLEKEGLIDRSMPVIRSTGNISVADAVGEFNDNVDGALTPHPSFREDVSVPLANQFKKWGWGLSSGKQAAVAGFKHLITFGQNFFELMGERKELINELKDSGTYYKEYVEVVKAQQLQQQQLQAAAQAQQQQMQAQQQQQQQYVAPQQNVTSVATQPSVTIVKDEDGLPKNGAGVKRGRPRKTM